jgi:hypothetical protein
MRRQVIMFFLAFTIILLATYGLLSSKPYSVLEGVTGFRLVGGCRLYYFTQPAQPMNAWALACPRTDMIRLWPLPVQQPWFEDWWEKPYDGFYTQG